jgi:hypothetical protein
MPNKKEIAENILIREGQHLVLTSQGFRYRRDRLCRENTKEQLYNIEFSEEWKPHVQWYWNNLRNKKFLTPTHMYNLVGWVAEGKQEEDEEPYYNMFADEIIWRKFGMNAFWATYPDRFDEYMDCVLENAPDKEKEVLSRFANRCHNWLFR